MQSLVAQTEVQDLALAYVQGQMCDRRALIAVVAHVPGNEPVALLIDLQGRNEAQALDDCAEAAVAQVARELLAPMALDARRTCWVLMDAEGGFCRAYPQWSEARGDLVPLAIGPLPEGRASLEAFLGLGLAARLAWARAGQVAGFELRAQTDQVSEPAW